MIYGIKASENDNGTSSEIENALRIEMPKEKENFTWTKPLIIDSNNHDFDTVSTFKFQENITYKPSQQYVYPLTYTDYPAAIIIAKDNITIDFAGYALSLDPSSASNFMVNNPTYGIAVYQGVKNLKIISTNQNKKGTISGFCGYAIYANGLNQSYNNYDMYSNMIKNLIIDNLLITQNINGVYIAHAIDINVSNLDIIYNYAPRIVTGIYCLDILSGVIASCKTNQNFSYTDVFGVVLQDTTDVQVTRCQANANRSLKHGSAIGFLITALTAIKSAGNQITSCIANRNLCSLIAGKKAIGFSIKNLSHHNSIEDCTSFLSSHIPGIPSGTHPMGIGFEIDNGFFNQINRNRSGYHDTYGFSDTALISSSFWSQNVSMLNTTSNYNVAVPTNTGPIALPVTLLYAADLNAFTGSGPQLVNLSVEFTT